MYAVTVIASMETKDFQTSTGIPTFYLDPTVQGIKDESHAKKIALSIVSGTYNFPPNGVKVSFDIHVERI